MSEDERPIIRDEDEASNEGSSAEGCFVKYLCFCLDPRQSYVRFSALFFMCLFQFGGCSWLDFVFVLITTHQLIAFSGSYFCFDNPASLEDNITSDLTLTSAQYGWVTIKGVARKKFRGVSKFRVLYCVFVPLKMRHRRNFLTFGTL